MKEEKPVILLKKNVFDLMRTIAEPPQSRAFDDLVWVQ